MRQSRASIRLIACAVAIGVPAVTIPSDAGAQDRPRARLRWQPHIGLHAGTPQRASIALGIMRPVWQASDFTSQGGPRVVVEPGRRAGKLRVGYARTGAFGMGYAVEAAVLREWGRRGTVDLPATGYGAELHGSMMFIDLGVGVYRMPGKTRATFSMGLVL